MKQSGDGTARCFILCADAKKWTILVRLPVPAAAAVAHRHAARHAEMSGEPQGSQGGQSQSGELRQGMQR